VDFPNSGSVLICYIFGIDPPKVTVAGFFDQLITDLCSQALHENTKIMRQYNNHNISVIFRQCMNKSQQILIDSKVYSVNFTG